MTDHSTPNLPLRDFNTTIGFYAQLGFSVGWRDAGWLILEHVSGSGAIRLELFPFLDLDPATSSFGACLRLDDADGFIAQCRAAAVPDARTGWPRVHPLRREHWGGRVGALIDPDGSLLRVIENPAA